MDRSMSTLFDLCIVMPVYNDWESAFLLLNLLNKELSHLTCHAVMVNDGSSDAMPDKVSFESKISVEVLELTRNIGHQKAISIGLSYINQNNHFGSVVVMDSDGEDRAQDIKLLIEESKKNPNKIIFAQRIKRKEGLLFKLFYQFYKIFFKIMVGQVISFGNFSLIPEDQLNKVVNVSEIWNNYSAGIIYSRVPYVTTSIERGKRLAGKSKMNLVALVLHGLSAIAVHSSVVVVRVFLASASLILLSLIGIITAIIIKFMTDLAIPGWISTVILGFALVVIQSLMISLFLIFVLLNHRTQKLFIPAKNYKDYLLMVNRLC